MRQISTSAEASVAWRAPAAGAEDAVVDGLSVSFARRSSDVAGVLLHPDIIRASNPDGAGPLLESDIDLALHSGACEFVLVGGFSAEPPFGVFLFEQLGAGRWALHTGFLPGRRGPLVTRAFPEAMSLMRGRHQVDSVETEVPAFNRAAGRMAATLGFRRVRVNSGAFLRDGVAHDCVLYELKGGGICQ